MSDRRGIAVDTGAHRTWLKWHRGHRFAGDISFTRQRIAEGMLLGASVEIDLIRFCGEGFAVLHDETLDRATTGTGRVVNASQEYLRGLQLRDDAGVPADHPVMLIDDLGQLLLAGECDENAVLQLDLKEASASIRDVDITAFAAAMSPVARSVILSGGDAAAVERLSGAVPDMPIGYDPCYDGAIERLIESRDFAGFVETALKASPRARMFYLNYELVLFADAAGYDLIDAFHRAGRRVDAYTVTAAVPEVLPKVRRLLDLKADQITTDDPVGLEALLVKHL
ncbi:glycerophosphodiester phosphodiesterase [Rhizobium sp. SEMIA 4085]|uniref:Glycerophosphoryl diester phosphodiesterase protein n=1 Tax=Rhizobium gallicum bv. gallicum R602sp TaxID=1041138 RepID=A0A0B4XDN8_9HYPH|nr:MULTISPECIES: glycerophosphodiester phosphodiesterase family protein [Rhizobium]AJD45201.1 glycerophosphoryl diester phosphodiesterase protein [Rhizobium gallicum bv. gallicum R602sp]NNH28329.1 glycerophosphodiester phosphodiesterase [Rhizobium sp. SEMIA 4085]TDW27286.1 glycerophosphoryl diester phosphodiesterase [Rhizobium azibense]